MDVLDSKIISILQLDGRASNAWIAREVGVSEGTVRRRVKRLIDEEFIQVVAMPNPGKLGFRTEVLIGLEVEPGKVDHVAGCVTDLDEVGWVSITTGAYDLFAWVTLESSEALVSFLLTKIGTIVGVCRMESFVNLQVKKRTFGICARD